MNLPNLPAVLSTTYNEDEEQHEVIIEHIKPTSRIKILDHNNLSTEDLKNIQFHIEDRDGNEFNSGVLSGLFSNITKNESDEFHSELKNNREAVPPFKIVIKSDTIDLSDYDFQISWKTIK